MSDPAPCVWFASAPASIDSPESVHTLDGDPVHPHTWAVGDDELDAGLEGARAILHKGQVELTPHTGVRELGAVDVVQGEVRAARARDHVELQVAVVP